jgi:preprotein translocase subunit SecF
MNRLLADSLTTLNSLLALVITIAGAAYGMYSAGIIGLLFGVAGGLIVAALACGFIAYVSLIEHHLRQISKAVRGQSEKQDATPERIEPTPEIMP